MKWGLQCIEIPRSHVALVRIHNLTATAPIQLRFPMNDRFCFTFHAPASLLFISRCFTGVYVRLPLQQLIE